MPHSWNQLGIGQKKFFLSLYTRELLKYINTFFFQPTQVATAAAVSHSYIKLNWQLQRFFFSLYTHMTRVSLNVSFSIFFTFSTFLSPPTSGHWTFALIVSLYDSTYCSRRLSLYVLLSLTLSMYFSLSSSLHTHTSHFLSLKRFLCLTINIFFLASNLRIWVLKSSTKFGFNT